MIFILSTEFSNKFVNRIRPDSRLVRQYYKRTELFSKNPESKLLEDHELVGKLAGFRAFSINKDIRVVYRHISSDEVIFLDIGTHEQVYYL